MMKIKKQVVEIEVTPQECGAAFASWGDDEQAEFMNGLAEYVGKHYPKDFCLQMQGLTDSDELTDAARVIMQTIGEYAFKEG